MRHKEEGVRRETAVIFRSKLGWAGVAATEQGICMVVLPKKDKTAAKRALAGAGCGVPRPVPKHRDERCGDKTGAANGPVLKKAVKILQKYFSGECVSFDLPLDLGYHTPFQQAVWRATGKVPFGETRSYAWIASKIKSPRAVRAVGQALGANPVPIIVPCHRVISSSGGLGGFSGGIGMKEKLLGLEAGNRRR